MKMEDALRIMGTTSSEQNKEYLGFMVSFDTPDNYVNIYVIQHDFRPVKGYYEKMIRKI